MAYLYSNKSPSQKQKQTLFHDDFSIDCQGYETDELLKDTFLNQLFYLYKSCSIGLKFASIINKGQIFNSMQFPYEFYFILTLKSLAMSRLGGQKHETIR